MTNKINLKEQLNILNQANMVMWQETDFHNLVYLVYLDLKKDKNFKEKTPLFSFEINSKGVYVHNFDNIFLNKKQFILFKRYLKAYNNLSSSAILLKTTNTYFWFSKYNPIKINTI